MSKCNILKNPADLVLLCYWKIMHKSMLYMASNAITRASYAAQDGCTVLFSTAMRILLHVTPKGVLLLARCHASATHEDSSASRKSNLPKEKLM